MASCPMISVPLATLYFSFCEKQNISFFFVLGVQGFVLDGVMGGTALYPAIAFAERVPHQ